MRTAINVMAITASNTAVRFSKLSTLERIVPALATFWRIVSGPHQCQQ
jgi:hypothetical protein